MQRRLQPFYAGAYSLMAEVHPVLWDRSGCRLGLPLEKRRHPRQLCQAAGLHLDHYRTAVEFDGGRLDVEREGYLLVHVPLADESHDFALPSGQTLVAFLQVGKHVGSRGNRLPGSDRRRHRLQHLLVPEGLLNEVDRARLHRLNRHPDVAVAAHQDYGKPIVTVRERGLKLQSARPGHSDIDDDAARSVRYVGGEKVLRAEVQTHLVPDGAQKVLDRTAHKFIVIHDMDDSVFRHLATPSSSEGGLPRTEAQIRDWSERRS